MLSLRNKKCKPCEEGGKPLTPSEYKELLTEVPDWHVLDEKKLSRDFMCADFKEAVALVNEIADVAEYEGHHPDLLIHDWNNLTVTFHTHTVKGLTENDFIMASKVDQVQRETKE